MLKRFINYLKIKYQIFLLKCERDELNMVLTFFVPVKSYKGGYYTRGEILSKYIEIEEKIDKLKEKL